jgi:hypothetical protein
MNAVKPVVGTSTRRLVRGGLVALVIASACGVELVADPDEDEIVNAATTSPNLVPTGDVDASNVVGSPNKNARYRNVNDGTAFTQADDGDYVRCGSSTASCVHTVRYSGGPSGVITSVKVSYRATFGSSSGDIQVLLFDQTTQIAAGPQRVVGDWTDLSETFTGLQVASASDLRTRVVMRRTSGSFAPRYSMIWIDVTVGDGSGSGSDGGSGSGSGSDGSGGGGSAVKYLKATILQYVDINTQVGVFKPNMVATDIGRIHVGLNKPITSAQEAGLFSLPGLHGAEFFSLAEIQNQSAGLKSRGYDYVDYDLEPGDGHSPDSDLVDPVASIIAASQAAHAAGLTLECSAARAITRDYGAQFAPYCETIHIQAQGLQTDPAAYEAAVRDMAAKLRAANPAVKLSIQVSTQREPAPGLTVLETMKQCIARSIDAVDGASVWYANNTTDIEILRSFAEWFHVTYH